MALQGQMSIFHQRLLFHYFLLYNDKNECLFEPAGKNPPAKIQGRKLSERPQFSEVLSNGTKEVQCEA